jgi:hypothetical protein
MLMWVEVVDVSGRRRRIGPAPYLHKGVESFVHYKLRTRIYVLESTYMVLRVNFERLVMAD